MVEELFENWEKPRWDDLFMAMAYLASTRSIDPSTKHGCVVTDKSNRVLSFGYNGPPEGCNDSMIPLERPEKYEYFAHSEENAINNSARKGIPLEDSVFYITGEPCNECLRSIINVGASKIIYGAVTSKVIDSNDKHSKAKEIMMQDRNLQLIPYTRDEFLDVFEKAKKYYEKKMDEGK